MKKVYACLTGSWVCLDDDPNCVMGSHRVSPYLWYEEGAEIYAPITRDKADTYYQLNYAHIFYKGKDYRINPISKYEMPLSSFA